MFTWLVLVASQHTQSWSDGAEMTKVSLLEAQILEHQSLPQRTVNNSIIHNQEHPIMKTLLFIALPATIFITACESPQPVVIERHHYYQVTTPAPKVTKTRKPAAPVKYSPSVSAPGSAEGFRAVERTD
jgi:hypothetical protein